MNYKRYVFDEVETLLSAALELYEDTVLIGRCDDEIFCLNRKRWSKPPLVELD